MSWYVVLSEAAVSSEETKQAKDYKTHRLAEIILWLVESV